MKTTKILFLSLFLSIFFLQSCNNDDESNTAILEEEEITHVVLTVGGTPYTYDVEAATLSPATITFTKGVEQDISMIIENRSDPADIEDITEEIMERLDEHFFVYATTLTGVVFTRTDDTASTDNNGNKIGLKASILVDDDQTGSISIRLVHEPTAVDDMANGNLGSATGGSDDFDQTFPVTVTQNF